MTLGIDIGGTTINFGLVEGSKVVKKVQIPSFPSKATLDDTLLYLGDRAELLLIPSVEKIGIGVPSITDPVRGIVYNAVNIPSWDVVPLKDTMEERFGIPVMVNNDANCYALGAAKILEKNYPALVCVTLGTGTGVGIVLDGKVYSGTHCGAGEIASIPYNGKDYESFCSKKFFTAAGTDPKSMCKAAENGDVRALDLFNEFGCHLGEFLSVVMYAYDADCIVIGGGIARSFHLFKDAMWDTLRARYPYEKALEDLVITPIAEEDTALIGAASL